MPRRQPFTKVCQQTAQLAAEAQRADLHLHSTASDGLYSPTDLVQKAALRGLGAIALTDHDTLAGLPEALAATSTCRRPPEVIPGVEITCIYRGRCIHVLAYFVDPAEEGLRRALAELRLRRRQRFEEMLRRLPPLGLAVDEEEQAACLNRGHVLGRLDLARLLVRAGHVTTPAEAFACYLHDEGPVHVPQQGLPVGEALDLIHRAGGIASWAHPPLDVDLRQVEELRSLGLGALEAFHPGHTSQHETCLLHLAQLTGLGVTGGSDNHGPTPATRSIGAKAIGLAELNRLRRRAAHRLHDGDPARLASSLGS